MCQPGICVSYCDRIMYTIGRATRLAAAPIVMRRWMVLSYKERSRRVCKTRCFLQGRQQMMRAMWGQFMAQLPPVSAPPMKFFRRYNDPLSHTKQNENHW